MKCCVKTTFITVNLIFMLAGAGAIGAGTWVMVTSPEQFDFLQYLNTNPVVIYGIVMLGFLMFLVGLNGCVGGCRESACVLDLYQGIVIFLLLGEISLIVVIILQRNELELFTGQLWDALNDETKYFFQKQFECCGFQNVTDYALPVADLHQSCFSINNTVPASLYARGCFTGVETWAQDNMDVLIGIGGGLSGAIALQIFQSMMACCLRYFIGKQRRVVAVPPLPKKSERAIQTDTKKDAQSGPEAKLDIDTKPQMRNMVRGRKAGPISDERFQWNEYSTRLEKYRDRRDQWWQDEPGDSYSVGVINIAAPSRESGVGSSVGTANSVEAGVGTDEGVETSDGASSGIASG
ncbi:tetraspanin-9-like isoform X1 [Branchiostoma floridae]|uniref:Tetraspanin-9-like isoform X1 n=2 Tax=Branchiostoma floridae TaxID=7739 RepID=A0A9J7MTE9_BRAFL|nr:tetraspanin-9-like isoform X1 [Branchiostoma floridae]